MSTSQLITIHIDDYRTDGNSRSWDLPPWGHPIAYGVFPLFIGYSDRLIPVGTAFSIGSGVTFVLSATHNVAEAFNHEKRLQHLLTSPSLSGAVNLNEVSFWLLYPHVADGANSPTKLTLWPLETFNGQTPTDLVIGFPKFQSTFGTLSSQISFELPSLGERIRSIGYTDFSPADGVNFEEVRSGRFNWLENYSHKLRVVEGFVETVFTERFSSGYLNGPCFVTDSEIFHGQSGGPAFDDAGRIRGVNSASASIFFERPTSLISMLAPLLFVNVSSGINLAPTIRFNNTQPFFDWIGNGMIKTDGSETELMFRRSGTSIAICGPSVAEGVGFVFDDFRGFQGCLPPTLEAGAMFRLKRNS